MGRSSPAKGVGGQRPGTAQLLFQILSGRKFQAPALLCVGLDRLLARGPKAQQMAVSKAGCAWR